MSSGDDRLEGSLIMSIEHIPFDFDGKGGLALIFTNEGRAKDFANTILNFYKHEAISNA